MHNVSIMLRGGIMPRRMHASDACYDICVPEDTVLREGRQVIPLGFSLAMPPTLCAAIESRSGFASQGMEVEVSVGDIKGKCRIDADVLRGIVDSGYRGEVGAIVRVGRLDHMKRYVLPKGTRIAQMKFESVPECTLVPVLSLPDSDRDGGFGHTGAQ